MRLTGAALRLGLPVAVLLSVTCSVSGDARGCLRQSHYLCGAFLTSARLLSEPLTLCASLPPPWLPRAPGPYPHSFVASGQVEPWGNMESLQKAYVSREKATVGSPSPKGLELKFATLFLDKGGTLMPLEKGSGCWAPTPESHPVRSQLPCSRLQSQ